MNLIAILVGLVMLGLSVSFISAPFRRKGTLKTENTKARPQNEEGRLATLSALRDLDFDHRTGKVIDEDYAPARAQLLAAAARFIHQHEQEEQNLDALIQARRASKKANCEGCGASLETGQRFCTICGAPVKNIPCPSCGKKVRAGDLFCSSCGSQLEVRVEAVGPS